jgi:hypothetical protein
LGYDFNTVEFAVRDGIPYAIDFGNPAPDGWPQVQKNFEWVVEESAKMAIAAAKNKPEKWIWLGEHLWRRGCEVNFWGTGMLSPDTRENPISFKNEMDCIIGHERSELRQKLL